MSALMDRPDDSNNKPVEKELFVYQNPYSGLSVDELLDLRREHKGNYGIIKKIDQALRGE